MKPFVFCELIEDWHGIKFLRTKTDGEISARLYMGPHGQIVIIDTTDPEEDIDTDDGRGYLFELGYGDQSEAMFPLPILAPPPPQILEDGTLVEQTKSNNSGEIE